MRVAFAALAVFTLVAVPASAQPCRDALVKIRPDCRFAPMQSSAAVAYLASIGATAVTVGGGYLIYAYGPGDPTRSSFTSEEVGGLVMALGVMIGPSVGNLTLGAGDAVAYGMRPKMIGAVMGSGLGLAGMGLALGCVLSNPDGGGEGCGPAEDAAVVLLVTGAAAVGTGLLVGTMIDLATIPSSARRLHTERDAERPSVTVSLAPGGVALRVAL